MHLFTIVAFSVLPFLVGAVPLVSQNPSPTGRSFSVPLTKRMNHIREDGTVDQDKLNAGIHHHAKRYNRALDIFERNTGKPHPLAQKRGQSNERRAQASISLTNHSNVEWTGTFQIGTPPQNLNLQMDTLFSDTFLAATKCTTCGNQNSYDISSSTTAEDQNETVAANFDGSDINGEVVVDIIYFGTGFPVKQKFVAASSSDNIASLDLPFPADGVLGVGLSKSSVLNNSESVFQNLFSQTDGLSGSEPVFGLVLSDSVGAELIVGATDSTKFTGDLTFIKMNSLGFWQIQMGTMTVNGNTIATSTTSTVFDSAGLQITADEQTILNIYDNIFGSAPVTDDPRQYTLPCNTSLAITMSFGGTDFIIPPSSYVLGPIPIGSDICSGGFAVTSSELDMSAMHIGTVLMENLYTQFDIENLQLGLAQVTIPQ